MTSGISLVILAVVARIQLVPRPFGGDGRGTAMLAAVGLFGARR